MGLERQRVKRRQLLCSVRVSDELLGSGVPRGKWRERERLV